MVNTNQSLMAEERAGDITLSDAESLRPNREKHHRVSTEIRNVFLLNNSILNEEAMEAEMADLHWADESRGAAKGLKCHPY